MSVVYWEVQRESPLSLGKRKTEIARKASRARWVKSPPVDLRRLAENRVYRRNIADECAWYRRLEHVLYNLTLPPMEQLATSREKVFWRGARVSRSRTRRVTFEKFVRLRTKFLMVGMAAAQETSIPGLSQRGRWPGRSG